jgi:hypothetical protein
MSLNYTFPEWSWVVLASLRILAILGLALAIERMYERGKKYIATGILIFTLGLIISAIDGFNRPGGYESLKLSQLFFNVGICYLSYYVSIVKHDAKVTSTPRSRAKMLH